MYPDLLKDMGFFEFLGRLDADLAEEARRGGCPHCRGVLHCARYPRKPRGGPPGLGRESWSSDRLRLAFMREEHRTQRRSDGTISVQG